MGEWRLHQAHGNRTVHRRELEGLDRIMVYVEYEQWDDEDAPSFYSWQVSDGSCGKTLDGGYVDGKRGLRAAQVEADAAAARLFPGH